MAQLRDSKLSKLKSIYNLLPDLSPERFGLFFVKPDLLDEIKRNQKVAHPHPEDYIQIRRWTMNTSTDRIERKILLKAPRARVWRALSNAEEFGNWFGVTFGVDLKGKTFAPGQRVQGRVSCQGYENLEFEMTIEQVEQERLLSWRWHPYATDPAVDYSEEPTTLVVFELEDADGGTILSVI